VSFTYVFALTFTAACAPMPDAAKAPTPDGSDVKRVRTPRGYVTVPPPEEVSASEASRKKPYAPEPLLPTDRRHAPAAAAPASEARLPVAGR
jgi:hypothetical protein